MKLAKSEQGQVLIILALAAIGIFAIVALAVDGSAKLSDRRHAQNAADAAALAGALTKVNELTDGVSDISPTTLAWATCPPPSGVLPSPVCAAVLVAALDRANDNGYDDNPLDEVEVYSPPISGYYAGNSLYVQVIITSKVNTYFGRIIGWPQTQNVVEAVALMKEGGPLFDGASIVSLNPSPSCGNGSVNVGGNGTINLSGGGIFVNSDESCGYSQTSCSVTLNISSGGISSAGSPILQGCGTPAPASTGIPQVAIPDEVYMPDIPDECSLTAATPSNTPAGSDTWIIYPGYYTDFPQAGLIGNNKDIILAPGVYCVDNDLHWSGATFDSLDGTSGVTIYITAGHEFSISINSPIYLEASTSGDYEGYLIILNGTHTSPENCTINGGSYLDMDGTIFAPYCSITINGDNSSNSTFNAQVIGWDIKLNGNNSLDFQYNPGINAETKRKIGLMK